LPKQAEQTISVFISYRREGGFYLARGIYDDLKARNFNVFMDLQTVGAGDFARTILTEIASRDYFLIVLTVGSMERMLDDDDWLRKELAAALAAERTIIPVLDVRFDFDAVAVTSALDSLPKQFRKITSFNAVRMPAYEYFDNGLARLRSFLVPKRNSSAQTAAPSPHELSRAESGLRAYDRPSAVERTGDDKNKLPGAGVQDELLGADSRRLNAPVLTGLPGGGCSWTKVPGAAKYILQKSSDRNFQSSSIAHQGTDTSYRGPRYLVGRTDNPTTFYRVKAIGNRPASRDSEWSNTYEEKPRSPAPPLSAPVLTVLMGRGFSWTKVPGATEYILQKSSNRNFESSSIAYQGIDTSYKGSGYLIGRTDNPTTFYRVKAIGNRPVARDGEWSNVVSG
jgi:hypothetical protein